MPVEPKASELIDNSRRPVRSDVVRFVRQVSHDLRNHLNVVELQLLTSERLQTDPEAKEEIKRLREMTFKMGRMLAEADRVVRPESTANDALQGLGISGGSAEQNRKRIPRGKGRKLNGNANCQDEMLQIDPQQLQLGISEIFANAFQHERGEGPISVNARGQGWLLFAHLREPKANFELSTEKLGS